MKRVFIRSGRGSGRWSWCVLAGALLFSGGAGFGQPAENLTPLLVGRLATTGAIYDVAVNGNYAFLANAERGLQIADISDRTNPILVSELQLVGFNLSGRHLAVAGGYVFASTANGFAVVDVSDPAAPEVVVEPPGEWSYGLALSGHHLLLAVRDRDGSRRTAILDVSEPTNPVEVSSVARSADRIAISGGRAYLVGGTRLVVVDISDPLEPGHGCLLGNRESRGILCAEPGAVGQEQASPRSDWLEVLGFISVF